MPPFLHLTAVVAVCLFGCEVRVSGNEPVDSPPVDDAPPLPRAFEWTTTRGCGWEDAMIRPSFALCREVCVVRYAPEGQAAVIAIDAGPSRPGIGRPIAATDDFVFMEDGRDLLAIPALGGDVRTVDTPKLSDSGEDVRGLLIATTHGSELIYGMEEWSAGWRARDRTLRVVDVAKGTPPRVLTHLYDRDFGSLLAIDQTHVYMANGPLITRVLLEGGELEELVVDTGIIQSLAVGDGDLYYVSNSWPGDPAKAGTLKRIKASASDTYRTSPPVPETLLVKTTLGAAAYVAARREIYAISTEALVRVSPMAPTSAPPPGDVRPAPFDPSELVSTRLGSRGSKLFFEEVCEASKDFNKAPKLRGRVLDLATGSLGWLDAEPAFPFVDGIGERLWSHGALVPLVRNAHGVYRLISPAAP